MPALLVTSEVGRRDRRPSLLGGAASAGIAHACQRDLPPTSYRVAPRAVSTAAKSNVRAAVCGVLVRARASPRKEYGQSTWPEYLARILGQNTWPETVLGTRACQACRCA